MTVVEVRNKMDDVKDQFPVGMRVLAVDDDPTCLSVLERKLRKCQYHVTATQTAITALKLLRENKNKYDLVISDVHMPDMDGFKLLELVGLEMDLPVIMLSVNDDPKMVMKGITHGACDYLLKPVRMEELQNIWQHVIRRKKIDSKDRNKTSNHNNPNSENKRGSVETQNSDQNGKLSKKRKDQDEDEEEEHENDHDNEESTTQKKARVVWSVELHGKFVAAVNQLGIDKAVPKKILDLMNVEKLTRENVASHLQKYRLYLKRISCVANQQANMVAALGSADASYLRMNSLSGYGNLQTLSGTRHFLNNNSFRPFQPGGIIGRLTTPAGLNLHGLPSSATHQLGQAQNLNNSSNDQFKFQSGIVGGNNQNGIQGMTMPSISPTQNLNTLIDVNNKATFPSFSSKLSDQKPKVAIMGCSPSPLLDISNNALMFEANSMTVTPQNSSSQFGRCSSDFWSNIMICTSFQGGNLSGVSSITSLSGQSLDSLKDMHGGIFANTPMPFQSWDDQSHRIGSSMDSSFPLTDPQGDVNSTFNRNVDSNVCDPLQMKHDEMMELAMMNQLKSQNSRVSNNFGLLDEIAVAMMNQKQQNVKSADGSFSSDNNSFSGGLPM